MSASTSVVVSVLAASAAAVGISLALQPESAEGPSPEVLQLRGAVQELLFGGLEEAAVRFHHRIERELSRP